MRTWGRVNGVWTLITTDANGLNDGVYLTTLIQVLKLAPGESPFYANYGIPSQPSVVQQLFPDLYVNLTQQQFAQYFASLSIVRTATKPPTYQINLVTNTGALVSQEVVVPQ
jgi:hypothetical protein